MKRIIFETLLSA